MKVAHVIRSLLKSGAERICIDICNELHKNSTVEVLLIVLDEINEFQDLTKDLNIVYCQSKVRPSILGKSYIDTSEYEKIILDFKPDIIHSHLFWAEILTREVIYPEVTYLTHCHSNIREFQNFSFKSLFNKTKLTQFYEKRWLMPKYKICRNNFLVISNDSREYFQKVLPKPIQNIKLLHNAINYELFKRKSPFKPIDSKKIKLINVGSFTKNKNQAFLIKVVSYLVKKEINVELIFLGKGPEKKNVKNLSVYKELESRIQFKGTVDNVQDYLNDSDIYVHSAIHESFGLVLLEAMAARLPVISIDGKGNRDVVLNGKNGYLINDQNVEEFGEKIISLVNDRELHKNLSSNAFHFAEKFDISNYCEKLIEIYKKILIGNPQRKSWG